MLRRLCLLVLLIVLVECVSQSARAQDNWTGQAQCQLTVQSAAYSYQEVQTWAITGPPATGGGLVYPATWSVAGQGGRQDISGAQTVRAQWKTSVPPMNAPLRIFVNSGNQLIIKSYHAQLRLDSATVGSRQVTVAGAAQNASVVSFAEFEWQFPQIEVEATRTDVSGTSSFPVTSAVGPLQPPGTSATATCQWQFSKGEPSATMLAHRPVADAPALMSQAQNSVANSSATVPQTISTLPVGTQIARNPASQVSIAAQPSDSPASVSANAGPAAYAAPSTAGASPVAPTSSQPGLQALSQIASNVDSRSPSNNTLATSGSSTPSGSPLQNTRPAVSGMAQPIATPSPAPSGFTAKNVGNGSVQLTWQPVSGTSKYRVQGTGIAASGLDVSLSTTSQRAAFKQSPGTTVQHVPLGPGSWQITTLDLHNIPSSQTATASAVVRYVPMHSGSWLSKNNGPGNEASTKSHYLSLCDACTPGATFGTVAVALGLPSNSSALSGGALHPGYGCAWAGGDSYGGGGLVCGTEAVYNNITEFGTSRKTLCLDLLDPTNNHITKYYLCYAKSGDHGLTVIAWTPQYTWFLTFTDPNPADSVSNYTLSTSVNMDSEGPKYPPNACLSCHGGKFDGKHVTGTSLLPLDPGLLQVSDTSAKNMLNILAVNQRVMASGPSVAVKRYLTGLYGTDPQTLADGSSADSDYVPQGWKQQSGFYKMTVKPYCMMCHLTTPSNLDFSTYDGFAQNKDLINAEVCSGHTMPHAEYPFKQFWTKDTGNIFLPGYLAAGAGITACQ